MNSPMPMQGAKLGRWLCGASFLVLFSPVTCFAQTAGMDDEPVSPMLLYVAFFFLALVMLIIGIILACVVIVCLAALGAMGMVSSAAVVGMIRQRASAGFRVFHYQVCLVIAVPCGVGAAFLVRWITQTTMDGDNLVWIGAGIGAAAGLVGAIVLDYIGQWIARRVKGRVQFSFVTNIARTSPAPDNPAIIDVESADTRPVIEPPK